MKKYPYTQPIEAPLLTSFVGDVLAGRASPLLKSEEVSTSYLN